MHKYRIDYSVAQSCFLKRIGTSYGLRNKIRPKWTPPPPGWLMINCDAALDLHSGRAGVGTICRDEAGKVIECAAWRKAVDCSVATLEAMAVFDGLILA